MRKIFILLSLLVFASCNTENENIDDTFDTFGSETWEKYVGSLSGFDYPRIFELSYSDTTVCSGYKDGRPWFALYRTSDATKILEWEDTEKFDTNYIYKFDLGYGEYDEFRVANVAPCFYHFYDGASVVELTFCRYSDYTYNYYSIGPWGCNNEVNLYGLGLSQDLIGGAGYYATLQQIIFINKDGTRTVKDCTRSENGFWPAHLRKGYKESVFLGYDCLTYGGEVLFTLDFMPNENARPELDFYVDYDEFVQVSSWKTVERSNFRLHESIWKTDIIPPFEVPDDADPRYEITRTKLTEEVAAYHIYLLFRDGSEHEFDFEVNLETGEYKNI